MRLAHGMILALLVGMSSCQKESSSRPDSSQDAPAPSIPHKQERLAYTQLLAERDVLTAWRGATLSAVSHWSASALEAHEEKTREQLEAVRSEDHQAFSILFSSNNHGETEDCGCKNNPLGGLARRATLIEWALGETLSKEAQAHWDAPFPEGGTRLIVDAGDGFFRSTGLVKFPKSEQKMFKKRAEAVVASLNTFPLDAVNLGEFDLAFGLETVLKWKKRARFPLISANLRREDGSSPLPPLVRLERNGATFLIVGVLKPKPRVPGYYKEQGLKVEEPRVVLPRLLTPESVAGVDVVLLLSNLGLPGTQKLLKKMEEQGVRVDVAVVSNSNRITRQPEWAGSTPLVEPTSRGKYFGRIDLYRSSEEPRPFSFSEQSAHPKQLAIEFRTTWSRYFAERLQFNELEQNAARETLESLGVFEEVSDEANKGALDKKTVRERLATDRQKTAEAKKRRREVLNKRLAINWSRVLELQAEMSRAEEEKDKGQDLLKAMIIPVKLSIPEAPKTRKVLDRASLPAGR